MFVIVSLSSDSISRGGAHTENSRSEYQGPDFCLPIDLKNTFQLYFLDFVPKTPLLRPFEICTENEIFQNIDRNVIFSLKRSLNKSRIGM